jgi:tetrapyrrole methylase family protein/MazG family protein
MTDILYAPHDPLTLFAAVGMDPMAGAQIVPAARIADYAYPQVETGLPLLITGIDSPDPVETLEERLLNTYPATHPVTLIRPGENGGELRTVAASLGELDRLVGIESGIALYVPRLERGDFTDLQEIVARLRAPDGCPWDRVQTLASLRQDLLGETVEVLEAIDAEQDGRDNSAHIAEELGDVLLLVTMMTQIATEEGRFQMADVIRHIVTKLIRRHPHVFGDVSVNGVEDIFANWDEIKAQEKAERGEVASRPLDGVPAHLPALEKARKLQSKAAKAGLLDREALAASEPGLAALLGEKPDEARVGEILWALVALARERDIDAENALRAYAVAFRRQHEE